MRSSMGKAAGVMVISVVLILTGCSKDGSSGVSDVHTSADSVDPQTLVKAPFDGEVKRLPPIRAPKGFDWRQFEGTELRFISENTPPSSALAANIDTFEKATGIQVKIEQSDLGTVVEKVGLDFHARSGKYQLIYADPYQILSKHSHKFVDLHSFDNDPHLPHLPGGLKDFYQFQVEAGGYMGNRKHLYALPYDNPTIVLAYRKDVFQKYKKRFMKEKGYDWTPGPELTWEKYYEITKWINRKASEGVITEVKYGAGHQAKQHDSLMNDFSNVLAAYGGDYFNQPDVGNLGAKNPGPSALTSPESIKAAGFYNKLLKETAPGSTSWDWNGLGEAFAAGDLAMAPEWHEFSSSFEDPAKSKVAGKVGWTLMPKGPERSANIFGGTGIGISKYASEREQKAAWLFIVWATSPQAQLMILQSDNGGSTPTRHSVYQLPEVQRGMKPGTAESKEMPNLLPMKATLEAWTDENIYMRPKIPRWAQVDTFVYTELSNMIANESSPVKGRVSGWLEEMGWGQLSPMLGVSQTPEETMKSIKRQADQLHKE